MLVLVFLYHVWKRFSELALQFGKSKHYGWYGILIYIGGVFLAFFLLGFLNEVMDLGINFENNTAVNLMEIPIGLLSCYLMYQVLKKKWKLEFVVSETIDDIGKSTEEDSIQ